VLQQRMSAPACEHFPSVSRGEASQCPIRLAFRPVLQLASRTVWVGKHAISHEPVSSYIRRQRFSGRRGPGRLGWRWRWEWGYWLCARAVGPGRAAF
jgi:hypothetical protein